MTVELKPELERRVRRGIQTGQFQNVNDLLTKALDALDEKQPAAAARKPRKTAAEAIAHIREIRQGISLGGLTVKELMNEGRP